MSTNYQQSASQYLKSKGITMDVRQVVDRELLDNISDIVGALSRGDKTKLNEEELNKSFLKARTALANFGSIVSSDRVKTYNELRNRLINEFGLNIEVPELSADEIKTEQELFPSMTSNGTGQPKISSEDLNTFKNIDSAYQSWKSTQNEQDRLKSLDTISTEPMAKVKTSSEAIKTKLKFTASDSTKVLVKNKQTGEQRMVSKGSPLIGSVYEIVPIQEGGTGDGIKQTNNVSENGTGNGIKQLITENNSSNTTNETPSGYTPTGDPVFDAMMEIVIPLIEQEYGVDQPPSELTDEQLANIATKAEERFGPYYKELERQALEDFNYEKAGLETSSTRQKEDFVNQLKVGQQGIEDQILQLQTEKTRVEENKTKAATLEARNYEQAVTDSQNYLANVGLSRGGTRGKTESKLATQTSENQANIEQSAKRSQEEIERARQQSLQGFEQQYGLSNLPTGISYTSPYDNLQGYLPTTYTRGQQDISTTQDRLSSLYGRGQTALENQKYADILSQKESERAKMLDYYSQLYS